ncbi:uncharacterized protein LOC143465190 [Clavelina lepadiformis]|uniref:uncharacterized protein LOC143465190 n=1 Tax=Clavelina lepadiformis TaxID=159417 RepID=UPI0040434A01
MFRSRFERLPFKCSIPWRKRNRYRDGRKNKAKLKLNLTVAGIEATRVVFVAEKLSESCILGLDFLQDHGCIVDYDVMTLKAGGGTLPLLREPDVEREAAIEVIRRRQAAFSLSKRDLGKTNILTHSIDTGDAAPIRQHPRRMSEEN